MKIKHLLERPEEDQGRLETRTIDDKDSGEKKFGAEEDIPQDETPDEDENLDSYDDQNLGTSFSDLDKPDEPEISDDVWSSVSTDPYVTDYDHTNKTTLHPRELASKSKDELTRLQSQIDDQISKIDIKLGGVGLYKNETYKYLNSMKSFIQKIRSKI